MFKNIFKSIALFLLLILNATLFTWYANTPPSSDQARNFNKKLISDVQAKSAVPSTLSSTHLSDSKNVSFSKDSASNLNALLTQKAQNDQKIVLKFESVDIQLDSVEEYRLETLLDTLNINGSYTVRISAGPVPSNDNTDASKTSKLRAQTVARIIYPYTQKITMFYQPNLAVSTVVVEIFPVQIAKKP